MSSTNSADDPSFLALPKRLRHRIDGAFDSIVSSEAQLRRSGFEGGFIVESESGPSRSAEYEAGGFIVEDLPSSSSVVPSHILLSQIPRALNHLHLFPDDDIMRVFDSAATGWGAQNVRNDRVSRRDWRAVCAALLEGEHVEGSDKENPVADEDFEVADSGPDGDEYQTEELSDDAEEASSDEYEEPGQNTARARKAPRGTPAKSSETEASRQLTESQKTRCRQDFSRFFPHVPDNELDHQRIMIKDITRVANLLSEDLKAEQILEMLEAFSTSPDRSMNLANFEHMMVLTKLV